MCRNRRMPSVRVEMLLVWVCENFSRRFSIEGFLSLLKFLDAISRMSVH